MRTRLSPSAHATFKRVRAMLNIAPIVIAAHRPPCEVCHRSGTLGVEEQPPACTTFAPAPIATRCAHCLSIRVFLPAGLVTCMLGNTRDAATRGFLCFSNAPAVLARSTTQPGFHASPGHRVSAWGCPTTAVNATVNSDSSAAACRHLASRPLLRRRSCGVAASQASHHHHHEMRRCRMT